MKMINRVLEREWG